MMCSLPTTEFVEHIQSTTYQQYTHQTSISEQSHWNVKPNRNAAESPRPVKFWIQFSQAKKNRIPEEVMGEWMRGRAT